MSYRVFFLYLHLVCAMRVLFFQTRSLGAFALAWLICPIFAVVPYNLEAQELRVVEPPPSAILSDKGANAALALRPSDDVSWTVFARLVDGQIYNPETRSFDRVRLRAFQGDSTNPSVPFLAPTVRIKPGNTFRLEIVNDLPADDPSCNVPVPDVNIPHCFNSTNMHTHGLWISPVGNSDNVLLNISPGGRFTYEYNIPSDHPAGTFWYHPHLHGSTALQVSSGMAGFLIVEGERLPGLDANGDIDTILKNEDGSSLRERVVLLQQIQYACRDSDGAIKTDGSGAWVCGQNDIGSIEAYDQFGPSSWKSSGRFTTINGLVLPEFRDAVAGKPERWRIVHAGVRDSINLRFQKVTSATGDEPPLPTLRSEDAQSKFVEEVCQAEQLEQFSIATDGLTRPSIRKQTQSFLHPGYREDLVMVFPEPGIYCVVDGDAPGNETVSAENKSRKLLGFVRVMPGDGQVGEPEKILKDTLIAAARAHMPPSVSDTVIADINDGFKLTKFGSHTSLMEAEVDGVNTVGFNIAPGPEFQIGEFDASGNLINAKPFDPDVVNRKLPLGATEEWQIRSFFFGHPFHIHVNPFQVVEILDENGVDVSGHDPSNTSIYAGLKGTWRDTIFAANTAPSGRGAPYRIKVRTQYRRYIGKFVLHCHILDHEDQGMMQLVEIGLPDGEGGITSSHH